MSDLDDEGDGDYVGEDHESDTEDIVSERFRNTHPIGRYGRVQSGDLRFPVSVEPTMEGASTNIKREENSLSANSASPFPVSSISYASNTIIPPPYISSQSMSNIERYPPSNGKIVYCSTFCIKTALFCTRSERFSMVVLMSLPLLLWLLLYVDVFFFGCASDLYSYGYHSSCVLVFWCVLYIGSDTNQDHTEGFTFRGTNHQDYV